MDKPWDESFKTWWIYAASGGGFLVTFILFIWLLPYRPSIKPTLKPIHSPQMIKPNSSFEIALPRHEMIPGFVVGSKLISKRSFDRLFAKNKQKITATTYIRLEKYLTQSELKIPSKAYKFSGVPLVRKTLDKHLAVFGFTGTFKSSSVVIPSIITNLFSGNHPSMLVTDPKGEVYDHTSAIAQDIGYRVVKIDFNNPTASDSFNVLEPIYQNWIFGLNQYKTGSVADAMHYFSFTSSLISQICGEINKTSASAKGSFWENHATGLLMGWIWLCLAKIQNDIENYNPDFCPKWFNLPNIIQMITRFGHGDIAERIETYKVSNSQINQAKQLIPIYATNPTVFNDALATLVANTSFLNDLNVQQIICESKTNVQAFCFQPTLLYLISERPDSPHARLITLITNLIYSITENFKEDNSKQYTLFFLDELANIPKISFLHNLVTTGRSKKVFAMMVFQSWHQLVSIYGEHEAQTIINNSAKLILGKVEGELSYSAFGTGPKKRRLAMKAEAIRVLPEHTGLVSDGENMFATCTELVSTKVLRAIDQQMYSGLGNRDYQLEITDEHFSDCFGDQQSDAKITNLLELDILLQEDSRKKTEVLDNQKIETEIVIAESNIPKKPASEPKSLPKVKSKK